MGRSFGVVARRERATQGRLHRCRLSLRRGVGSDRGGGAPGAGPQQCLACGPRAGRSGRPARRADPVVAVAAARRFGRPGARPARSGGAAPGGRRPDPLRRSGPGADRHPALRRRRRDDLDRLRPDPGTGHQHRADPGRLRARGVVGVQHAGPAHDPASGAGGARSRHRMRRAVDSPGPAHRTHRRHRRQPAGASVGPSHPRPQPGRGRAAAGQPVRAGGRRALRSGRFQPAVCHVAAAPRAGPAGLSGR